MGRTATIEAAARRPARAHEAVARCLAAPHPWRAEVFGDNRAAIPDRAPVARLTYNPRFGELLELVDGFLAANSFRIAHPATARRDRLASSSPRCQPRSAAACLVEAGKPATPHGSCRYLNSPYPARPRFAVRATFVYRD